jgi:hypothetical protein
LIHGNSTFRESGKPDSTTRHEAFYFQSMFRGRVELGLTVDSKHSDDFVGACGLENCGEGFLAREPSDG